MRRFCTQIFPDIRSSVPLSFGSNPITLSQIQMTIKKDNFVQNAQPLSLLSYTIMTFSFPPKPFPAKPTHASTVHNTITQHPRIYIFSTFDTPKFQIEPLSLSLSLSLSLKLCLSTLPWRRLRNSQNTSGSASRTFVETTK